jgi:hypothetical protein
MSNAFVSEITALYQLGLMTQSHLNSPNIVALAIIGEFFRLFSIALCW